MRTEADQPLITIVIPTFNRATMLRRAIKSVQNQSFADWQLLIVDNASEDNTTQMVAELLDDPRIRYIRHDQNIGMLPNWDFAISKVETTFFSVLSDDDVILPEFFQATIQEMLLDEELGMCFGSTAIVDNAGKLFGFAPTGMQVAHYPPGVGALAMVKSQHPASTGTLFRMSCVNAVGGFDQASHYLADLDMMLRVAMRYPVKFIGREVAFHVAHDNNSFKDGSSWFPGLLSLFRNIKKQEVSDNRCQIELFKRLIRNAIFPIFLTAIRYPIRIYKAADWACAFQCLNIAQVSISVLLWELPVYIGKAIAGVAERKLKRLLQLGARNQEQQSKLQLHSLAKDYFAKE